MVGFFDHDVLIEAEMLPFSQQLDGVTIAERYELFDAVSILKCVFTFLELQSLAGFTESSIVCKYANK